MNLVPHQFDHSSLARLGSLLATGSLSLMGWKKASKRPVATYANNELACNESIAVGLTQLSTRSSIIYSSSSTTTSASAGISFSSGGHPRRVLI